MKKTFILFTLSILLSSCFNQEDNNKIDNQTENDLIIESNILDENIENTNLEDSSEGEIVESEYNEKLLEDEVIEELKEITHNNFKPLIEDLEKLTKEEIIEYDCVGYFYLPEPENRPQFQLDIQKEYIEKCELLKI